MPNSTSKSAFYLVSYNIIIFQILIAKITLSYLAFWVLELMGKLGDPTYILVGVYLIASIASIAIGIWLHIRFPVVTIEKYNRMQTAKATFLIIINVIIAPILSIFTFTMFLIIGNA